MKLSAGLRANFLQPLSLGRLPAAARAGPLGLFRGRICSGPTTRAVTQAQHRRRLNNLANVSSRPRLEGPEPRSAAKITDASTITHFVAGQAPTLRRAPRRLVSGSAGTWGQRPMYFETVNACATLETTSVIGKMPHLVST